MYSRGRGLGFRASCVPLGFRVYSPLVFPWLVVRTYAWYKHHTHSPSHDPHPTHSPSHNPHPSPSPDPHPTHSPSPDPHPAHSPSPGPHPAPYIPIAVRTCSWFKKASVVTFSKRQNWGGVRGVRKSGHGVRKSRKGLEKSGHGVRKSGHGVRKSGKGLEKSGRT